MKRNARELALKILQEINEKNAYSNLAINRNLDDTISSLDDSFIREIVYGVIENKLYLDWIIQKFSKIKFKKISPLIKEILRIGVYQIIIMDRIPDSAACNESVKLTKKYSHRGTQGFVNGILRNIVRNKENILLPDINNNPIDYLSIKYSHPKWMIEDWIEQFGINFTEKLCIANNERPKLNIRVNTLKISRSELIERLESSGLQAEKTKYAEDGIKISNPFRITDTKEFKNGYFTIQDESSMLVAQIMNPKEGSLVIDLCSAPGGKATHIAQIMNNKGQILSRDIHKHKLKLIDENTSRLGINIIQTQNFDALELDESLIEKADFCLTDVPCSGLGILRRKPDIKWKKVQEDIKEIVNLQYKILENGSKYLKSGGVLIYSTCTIRKEENLGLIRRFLGNNPEFKLLQFDDLLTMSGDFKNSKEGYIEMYPHKHGTDGFFIAKLVKNYND